MNNAHVVRVIAWMAVLALSACAAPGGYCPLEKWAELPLALYRNLPIVQVNVNGAPVRMVLDTGAERTVLTASAASRVGLAQGGRLVLMRGVGGPVVNWEARPESFTFAGIGVSTMRVMVAPIRLPEVDGIVPDGLLGADVLAALDVDLDLPRRHVSFYRARHCADGPPWTAPYTTVAVRRSARNALLLPVSLDGQFLLAELDSGTSLSAVALKGALKTGLPEEALDADPRVQLRGANPGITTQRLHRFHEIGIGQDVFQFPLLLVGGLQGEDWDMLLGSDYLRRKRVWLSYITGRIFISPPVGVIVSPHK
ncbi:MAG: aspartyl protease family protein [Acetobacteraceae bacterium]|nr:aspartyl protease family protein [Acetobacteraceae bacterium]